MIKFLYTKIKDFGLHFVYTYNKIILLGETMTCGIYKLKFNNTNKVYIGKSKNIEYRWIKHKYDLSSGRASKKLLKAYAEYGMPTIEIMCECTEDELPAAEAEAIEIYNSILNGFNTVAAIKAINVEHPCGENSGNTKYYNRQIEQAFEYTFLYPELTYKEIQDITGVNKSTIAMIVCGQQHKWLKTVFPEEYSKVIQSSTRKVLTGHKYLPEFIKFIRVSNEFHRITVDEHASILNISANILRNVAAGRTAAKLLKETIPEDYAKFMQLKYMRNNSGTTAAKKGKQIPTLINVCTGEIAENIQSIAEFSRQHGLTQSAIGAVILGKRATHKGWTIA